MATAVKELEGRRDELPVSIPFLTRQAIRGNGVHRRKAGGAPVGTHPHAILARLYIELVHVHQGMAHKHNVVVHVHQRMAHKHHAVVHVHQGAAEAER